MADDTITIEAGDTTAGQTYDGGDGNDTLALHAAALNVSTVFDLRLSTIISIETLAFTGTFGGVAQLNASQFGAGISLTGAFAGIVAGPETVQIFMNGATALNLSGITVSGFGVLDKISIFGDDAGETIAGTRGNDTITGAGGADTINWAAATGAIVFTLDASGNGATANVAGIGIDAITGFENIIGGSGGDTLTGNDANNTISGNLGNDTLDGGDGIDTLDYSYITSGTTTVILTLDNSGFPVLIDGDDDDQILNFENAIGGSGNDLITGNDGTNRLTGGLGNDTLNGGDGFDFVQWDAATGAIVFTLNASGGGATANVAGIGIDTIENMEGLTGGSGNDILTGNAFQNMLAGGGGNDTLRGGLGKDTLIGGAGLRDVADFADKGGAVWATLRGGINSSVFVNGGVEDTIRGIEDVIGGSANDILLGDAAANFFRGGGANDFLRGGGGIDILDGGAGKGDTADFSDITRAVLATLNGANEVRVKINGVGADKLRSIENLTGGSGADRLTGDGLANFLSGGDRGDTLLGAGGNDRLRGGQGKDILDGGARTDTADYADKTQGVFVTLNGANNAVVRIGNANEDTIRNIEGVIGGSRNDRLTGDARANHLDGAGGNDVLRGAVGRDVLDGAAGGDVLDGGVGRDRLTGGSGNDRFFFAAGFGRDVITDFDAGLAKTDKIAFASALFDTFAEVKAAASLVGGDVVITSTGGDAVRLDGVDSVNDLRPNDFLFV